MYRRCRYRIEWRIVELHQDWTCCVRLPQVCYICKKPKPTLSPTQGLSLFGGGTWLSCHTEILLADFILIIRCCKWQPIYPFTCIIHKTYFLKQKPSDPPSRKKISKKPTTHILYSSGSSFWGRYRVLLWLCVFRWTVWEGETKWGKKTINRCWACTCQISLV